MIILGIDPGSTLIGYGVISANAKLKFIDCGIIKINRQETSGLILEAVIKLSRLLKKYKPDIVGIEKLYFMKNIKTGIEVAQTRGALISEIAKQNIFIIELSPSEIKLATTNYGLADKKAVAKMVALLLELDKNHLKKDYDDATDALAVAIAAAGKKFIK